MANNVRPESMARITNKALADEFIAEQIKEINTIVKNRIQMSNLAIKINYFDFLFTALEEYEKELIKKLIDKGVY